MLFNLVQIEWIVYVYLLSHGFSKFQRDCKEILQPDCKMYSHPYSLLLHAI